MSNGLQHILILTPGFATDDKDDTTLTYLQHFIKAFCRLHPSIKVSIVSTQFPFREDTYDWHGATVHSIGGSNSRSFSRLMTWRRTCKLVRRLHRDNPIDVIHAIWLTECALLGTYMGNRLNVPCLVTAMGTDVLSSNRFLKVLPKNMSNLVFVSEFQKNNYSSRIFPTQSVIIPWGLPPLYLAQNTNMRDIDILGVGSLIPIKNFAVFIDVIKKIKQHNPTIRVCLIGAGELEEELRLHAERSGLEDTIKFLGQCTNVEVRHWMQRSKVLLHPSTFESQGFVFLEARQAGMSIVSFEVGVAEVSKAWYIGDTTEELYQHTCSALKTYEAHYENKYPVDGTVDAYVRQYNTIKA